MHKIYLQMTEIFINTICVTNGKIINKKYILFQRFIPPEKYLNDCQIEVSQSNFISLNNTCSTECSV